MPGRDLSGELFGGATSGPQDLSSELGLAPVARGKQAPLSRTERVLTGMADPIHGGAQLLTKMLPSGVVGAGNRFNNWLAENTGLVAKIPEGGVDQMAREREQAYQARRAAQGEEGFDAYRTGGNVLSPANLAVAARAPAVASLGGRMLAGAGTGAVSSALNPVTGSPSGSFWEEKLKQVGAGAASGGAFPAVAAGLGRVISPMASRNANLQLLQREGVRPTIGQAMGGAANAIEEKLQSVPLMGDMISRARRSANSDFERAAHNRALKPIGQELPPGLTGRDAVQATETALRDKYDDVLNQIGAIRPDNAFATKTADLKKMVKGMLMPKAQKARFDSALNEVKANMDANGVITSDAYKRLESSLGIDARKLTASTDPYEFKIGEAVKQLQEELRDMLGRQAGPLAGDLKAVNTGWANFKRVQNAAGKLGAEEGEFTAAQFQNAVRAMDKSKDKSAFARGTALGQDLGDAGKKILGNKVPDSGTPTRLMLSGLLAGGSTAINPAFPVALGAGGALYTSPAQQAMVAALTKRGASAETIAEILRKNSALLGGAAAPIGVGLLGQ